eukprot:COSAG02_NODE_18451_length_937_cov_75.105012_1_plen_172_part_00
MAVCHRIGALRPTAARCRVRPPRVFAGDGRSGGRRGGRLQWYAAATRACIQNSCAGAPSSRRAASSRSGGVGRGSASHNCICGRPSFRSRDVHNSRCARDAVECGGVCGDHWHGARTSKCWAAKRCMAACEIRAASGSTWCAGGSKSPRGAATSATDTPWCRCSARRRRVF